MQPHLLVSTKGHVHISAWYEKTNIPYDWKLSVSENGWTNNALGLEWLKHFNAHTRARQKGSYRLLILDGHKSHLNQENRILTLCMSPRSSHILQPLDVVCFSPLKLKYPCRRPSAVVNLNCVTNRVAQGPRYKLSYDAKTKTTYTLFLRSHTCNPRTQPCDIRTPSCLHRTPTVHTTGHSRSRARPDTRMKSDYG
jgi:hypothetical protein